MQNTTVFTPSDSSAKKLNRARQLFSAVTLRAEKVKEVLAQARNAQIRFPREQALDILTHRLASKSSGIPPEYACEEVFQEALGELLDSDARYGLTQVAGVSTYVVTPAFQTTKEHPSELGLGALTGYYSLANKEGLDIPVAKFPKISELQGLSEAEVDLLVNHYEKETLKVVNTLRDLETCLHYLRDGLRDWKARALAKAENREPKVASHFRLDAPWDPTLELAVEALTPLVSLGLLPKVAQFFGTEASRINPLKALPADFVIPELDEQLL